MSIKKFITIILLLSFNHISNSGINETFYRYLKNNSEFEIVDIDLKKFNRTKRRVDEITPSDILLLAEIVYSLYSGEINPQALLKLGKRLIDLGKNSLPANYDFIKNNNIMYVFQFTQRRCEPSAGYAVALLASYRAYMKMKDYEKSRFAAITIMEHFGRCKKFSVLDGLDFAHNTGLVTYLCRDEIYCEDCGINICPSLENLNRDTPITEEPYKIGEPYQIEGIENIKKDIYKNGPVITTYTLYDSMVYYKNGYVSKAEGTKIGNHEAIIYGWDEQGWLAQSVFGDYWGTNGKFKVAYNNEINFGKIAFAENENCQNIQNFFSLLLLLTLALLL